MKIKSDKRQKQNKQKWKQKHRDIKIRLMVQSAEWHRALSRR
jgi:hypothetical protein